MSPGMEYDSTQTNQTARLVWFYCVAIWCMNDFSSTNVKGNECCPFLRAHTHEVFKNKHGTGVSPVPSSTNDLILCDLILNNLSLGSAENQPQSDGLLDTWEELAPTPASSTSPHFRKKCCSTCKETSLCHPWCGWELSPISLPLERGGR